MSRETENALLLHYVRADRKAIVLQELDFVLDRGHGGVAQLVGAQPEQGGPAPVGEPQAHVTAPAAVVEPRAAVGAGPIGYGNALISRFPVAGWHVKRLGRGASSVEKRGERAWDPRSYHVSTASNRVMVAATLEVPEGAGGPIRQLSVASTHLATRESMAARQLAAAWGALAGCRSLRCRTTR